MLALAARYPASAHLGDFAAMNEYDFALDFNEPSGLGEYTGDIDDLADILECQNEQ